MTNKTQIVLIGDSLTDWNFGENGWGGKLQHWYGEKVKIVNSGYAGYTSKMIKDIINDIIPVEKEKDILLCVILLGTNDCFYKGRQVSHQDYKKNMLYIIDHIRSIYPKIEILTITPPITAYKNELLPYINVLYEIKTEHTFINILNLHTHPNTMVLTDLSDGIHLNDSGNKKLFQYVQNAIVFYYNHIIPSKIK